LARRETPWIEGPGPRGGKLWPGTWWIGPCSGLLVGGGTTPDGGAGADVSVRNVVGSGMEVSV